MDGQVFGVLLMLTDAKRGVDCSVVPTDGMLLICLDYCACVIWWPSCEWRVSWCLFLAAFSESCA